MYFKNILLNYEKQQELVLIWRQILMALDGNAQQQIFEYVGH